jgi:succinoglycan biosynthesis protein ExoL
MKTFAFFAHERGDARVRKRIAAFQDQGIEIIGYTFHRERDKVELEPTWHNIHLGTTYNRRYIQRLWALIRSLGILWRQRHQLGECAGIYAVNTDNAVLALIGRFFSGKKVPLVLELADIQPVMTGTGFISKTLRWIERQVLQRSSLLVTTSPGFVSQYFAPQQRFQGQIFLLENKVYPSLTLPAAVPAHGQPVKGGRPWVIGCFGALRCRRSLELMKALALELGEKVHFILRGYPSGTITADFTTLLGALPNLRMEGAYQYPGDLAAMYGAVDFNWAIDQSDPNGNSAWLLPNRIYEGGCFGVPVIAAAQTETGRWVALCQLGWTFQEPFEKTLAEFLGNLTPQEWAAVKARCESSPRTDFTGDDDLRKLAEILTNLSSS